jgi:hypothetical protein
LFPKQTTQQEIGVDLSGKHLSEIPDSVFQHTETTYLDLGSSIVTFYPPLSALVDTNSNNIFSIPGKNRLSNKFENPNSQYQPITNPSQVNCKT